MFIFVQSIFMSKFNTDICLFYYLKSDVTVLKQTSRVLHNVNGPYWDKHCAKH